MGETGAGNKKTPMLLLALVALVPAAESCVAVYFEIAPHFVFALGKVAMVALPLVIWRRAGLTRPQALIEAGVTGNTRRPGPVGMLSGAVLAAVILAAWYGCFAQHVDAGAVRAKADALQVTKLFPLFAAYLCLVNPLLEEYFFRAFLVGRTRKLSSSPVLVASVNGVIFGIHHVFVLASMIDAPAGGAWGAAVAGLVLGTMLGGFHWSMLRLRGYSVVDCWISHVMADAAIVWIAWEVLRPAS